MPFYIAVDRKMKRIFQFFRKICRGELRYEIMCAIRFIVFLFDRQYALLSFEFFSFKF